MIVLFVILIPTKFVIVCCLDTSDYNAIIIDDILTLRTVDKRNEKEGQKSFKNNKD